MIEGEGSGADRPKHLPLGKIGDVVKEIIECEVEYVINKYRLIYY